MISALKKNCTSYQILFFSRRHRAGFERTQQQWHQSRVSPVLTKISHFPEGTFSQITSHIRAGSCKYPPIACFHNKIVRKHVLKAASNFNPKQEIDSVTRIHSLRQMNVVQKDFTSQTSACTRWQQIFKAYPQRN